MQTAIRTMADMVDRLEDRIYKLPDWMVFIVPPVVIALVAALAQQIFFK